MTQTSVASDQAAPEPDVPEYTRPFRCGSLVADAIDEYNEKTEEIQAEREQRAFNLLFKVTEAADCVDEALIYSQNERIFCELDDDDLELEVFIGATPDEDFLTIQDYLGLPNPRIIRSLADLGRALKENKNLASEVIQVFRNAMFDKPGQPGFKHLKPSQGG